MNILLNKIDHKRKPRISGYTIENLINYVKVVDKSILVPKSTFTETYTQFGIPSNYRFSNSVTIPSKKYVLDLYLPKTKTLRIKNPFIHESLIGKTLIFQSNRVLYPYTKIKSYYTKHLLKRDLLPEFYYSGAIHNSCHSFFKDRSIKTACVMHQKSKFICKIDLANFYDTITIDHLFNHLDTIYDKNDKMYLRISDFLKQQFVTSYYSKNLKVLPQGGLLSPILSNIAFCPCDKDIFSFCLKNNIQYTRYADDLIFSSNEKLPINFVKSITSIVRSHKFIVNPNKTKIITSTKKVENKQYHVKQEVLGLTINRKINPDRNKLDSLRSFVDTCYRLIKQFSFCKILFSYDSEFLTLTSRFNRTKEEIELFNDRLRSQFSTNVLINCTSINSTFHSIYDIELDAKYEEYEENLNLLMDKENFDAFAKDLKQSTKLTVAKLMDPNLKESFLERGKLFKPRYQFFAKVVGNYNYCMYINPYKTRKRITQHKWEVFRTSQPLLLHLFRDEMVNPKNELQK